MVVPEYNSGNGRADYALFISGSPAMMVEAKKLHDNLHDRARSQGVQYCIEEGNSLLLSDRRPALGDLRNTQARAHRREAGCFMGLEGGIASRGLPEGIWLCGDPVCSPAMSPLVRLPLST